MTVDRTLPDDERLAVCVAIAELKLRLKTDTAVADAIGVSQQAVSLALKERHQAGPNMQRKVADFLKMSRDELTRRYAPKPAAPAPAEAAPKVLTIDYDDPYPARAMAISWLRAHEPTPEEVLTFVRGEHLSGSERMTPDDWKDRIRARRRTFVAAGLSALSEPTSDEPKPPKRSPKAARR